MCLNIFFLTDNSSANVSHMMLVLVETQEKLVELKKCSARWTACGIAKAPKVVKIGFGMDQKKQENLIPVS